MTTGAQASTAVHPQGFNSDGVDILGLEVKKAVPVNMIAGNGTAKMNGTSMRDDDVSGMVLDP